MSSAKTKCTPSSATPTLPLLQEKPASVTSDDLTYKDEVTIIEDLITTGDTQGVLKRYNLTTPVLSALLKRNSAQLQDIFANKCALQVYKENRLISELKEKAFGFFNDAIVSALQSENPAAYLRSVTDMIDKIDKIDRLNRGEATENIKTTNQTTTTTLNVSDLVQQLATPEQKRDFLLQKMESLKFNKSG